jgi:hypothetical protein
MVTETLADGCGVIKMTVWTAKLDLGNENQTRRIASDGGEETRVGDDETGTGKIAGVTAG